MDPWHEARIVARINWGIKKTEENRSLQESSEDCSPKFAETQKIRKLWHWLQLVYGIPSRSTVSVAGEIFVHSKQQNRQPPRRYRSTKKFAPTVYAKSPWYQSIAPKFTQMSPSIRDLSSNSEPGKSEQTNRWGNQIQETLMKSGLKK